MDSKDMDLNNKKIFIRNCPQCNIEITYKEERSKIRADEKNCRCNKCVKIVDDPNMSEDGRYWRLCPQCNVKIFHTDKHNKNYSEKKKRCCRECANILLKEKNTGENNPFFGKKHSDETKKKLKEAWVNPSDKRIEQIEQIRSEENREKTRKFFTGTSFNKDKKMIDIMIRKYGEEIGLIKYNELIEKQRNNSVGENNPMYGKPSPMGSGNGYSGWYKGWFFRSIYELSYMINHIEKNNYSWINGESQKYKISYVDHEGTNRNYFPDFIINGTTMVECKPLNLQTSTNVISKKDAAIIFCKQNGLIYEMIQPDRLTIEELIELYQSSQIKFTDRYETKFLDFIKKKGFEI